eukprot:Nitzschia sp. Nitz4//scaffold190_size42200//41534//42079//NITZ4_007397-RA/size42200-processed-gene-0.54-mRNA-1//-1//CDS//3329540159//1425//frame0
MTTEAIDLDIESSGTTADKPGDASVQTNDTDNESDHASQDSGEKAPTFRRRRGFMYCLLILLFLAIVGTISGLCLRPTRSSSLAISSPEGTSTDNTSTDGKPTSKEDDGEGFSIGDSGSTTSWPHLVGLSGDEAKLIIEAEGYVVLLVHPGEVTTKDYREDRVFIYVNEDGYVDRVPVPGR